MDERDFGSQHPYGDFAVISGREVSVCVRSSQERYSTRLLFALSTYAWIDQEDYLQLRAKLNEIANNQSLYGFIFDLNYYQYNYALSSVLSSYLWVFFHHWCLLL